MRLTGPRMRNQLATIALTLSLLVICAIGCKETETRWHNGTVTSMEGGYLRSVQEERSLITDLALSLDFGVLIFTITDDEGRIYTAKIKKKGDDQPRDFLVQRIRSGQNKVRFCLNRGSDEIFNESGHGELWTSEIHIINEPADR